MHFLGGERVFIRPHTNHLSLNDQLEDCLTQLRELNQDLELYKINFFVDSSSASAYSQTRKTLLETVSNEFQTSLLISVIAQPPLTCNIMIEAFFYNQKEWICENYTNTLGNSKLFIKEDSEFLIGTLQANHSRSATENSELVFEALRKNLNSLQFPINSIIRQWNYIEEIVAVEGVHQNYQDFNDVRSLFYNDHFKECGFPAATGIGMNQGGLIIEYIAMKSNSAVTAPVDNSQQISAHKYSTHVLKGSCLVKTTPKFERARYLKCGDKSMFFISGTASIIGEKTVGIDNPAMQTEVSINNIRELYSEQILKQLSINDMRTEYGHMRVYVKNEADFKTIQSVCHKFYGDLPMVFIKADVCRDNLLVEIEGEVLLK